MLDPPLLQPVRQAEHQDRGEQDREAPQVDAVQGEGGDHHAEDREVEDPEVDALAEREESLDEGLRKVVQRPLELHEPNSSGNPLNSYPGYEGARVYIDPPDMGRIPP